MSTGIYALSFNNHRAIYIGQSLDIETRYKGHLCTLKNSNGSKKLQNAYNTYGAPELIIIETCSQNILDIREKFWIQEFDSTNIGLNTTSGGAGGSGCYAGPSKYSEEEIILVFNYIVDTDLSYKEIEKISNVGHVTIKDIANLYQHKWLEDRFPDKYTKLRALKGTIRNIPGPLNKYTGTKLVSPFGAVVSIGNESLASFCKKYGIYAGKLSRLIRGAVLDYRGWRVYNDPIKN